MAYGIQCWDSGGTLTIDTTTYRSLYVGSVSLAATSAGGSSSGTISGVPLNSTNFFILGDVITGSGTGGYIYINGSGGVTQQANPSAVLSATTVSVFRRTTSESDVNSGFGFYTINDSGYVSATTAYPPLSITNIGTASGTSPVTINFDSGSTLAFRPTSNLCAVTASSSTSITLSQIGGGSITADYVAYRDTTQLSNPTGYSMACWNGSGQLVFDGNRRAVSGYGQQQFSITGSDTAFNISGAPGNLYAVWNSSFQVSGTQQISPTVGQFLRPVIRFTGAGTGTLGVRGSGAAPPVNNTYGTVRQAAFVYIPT
jgi:hypothetical protein